MKLKLTLVKNLRESLNYTKLSVNINQNSKFSILSNWVMMISFKERKVGKENHVLILWVCVGTLMNFPWVSIGNSNGYHEEAARTMDIELRKVNSVG